MEERLQAPDVGTGLARELRKHVGYFGERDIGTRGVLKESRPGRSRLDEKDEMPFEERLRLFFADTDRDRYGDKTVAVGTWFYNGVAPQCIEIRAKPARFAASRYDDDDRLDESRPIPETKDGFLYYSWPGGSTDHLTIEDVKACENAQPWGPVIWDEKNLPFELKEKVLRELAMRESLKLLPMALDVPTRLRTAGATPEQIGFVLRFATALTRAKSDEEFHQAIAKIILEERGAGRKVSNS